MSAIQRPTAIGTTHAQQRRLRESYSRLTDLSDKIALGKKFRKGSEDPVAASHAAMLQDHLDHLGAIAKSSDDSLARLNTADSKLQQASDLYARLKELIVQGANATADGLGRRAIAQEIGQIRDSLVAIANSEYLGQPLFSGVSSGAAVEFDAGSSTWVFTGDATDVIERRISPSESLRTNITAAEVFQASGSDMFTMLDDLSAALAADDVDGIRAANDLLDGLRSTMSAAQAQIGAAANRVQVAIDRNNATDVVVTGQLSLVRDVDLAEAITEQALLQSAYQAALGVTARVGDLSLLDFLR